MNMDNKKLYNFLKSEVISKNLPDMDDMEIEKEVGHWMESLSPNIELQKAINDLERDHKPSENYGLRCITCNGTGSITTYENGAPQGEGYWAMPVEDMCPVCFEQGFCPNCHFSIGDNTECKRCGWKESE